MAVKARCMLFASVLATASTVLTGIAHSQTGIASVYSGGGGLTAAIARCPSAPWYVSLTIARTVRSWFASTIGARS